MKGSNSWRDLFISYKNERKQLLVWSVFILLFIGFKYAYFEWWIEASAQLQPLEFYQLKQKEEASDVMDEENYSSINVNTNEPKDWMQFGFSKKQAEAILTFKQSRGGFKSVQEVSASFVIDGLTFRKIRPFLSVKVEAQEKPDSNEGQRDDKKTNKKVQLHKWALIEFDPNTSSFSDLVALGFSEKQARTVIKYREKVGYYHSSLEFGKLYNLSEDDFQRVLPFLKIDPIHVNVNTCSVNDLKIKVRIKLQLARKIVEFRDHLGGFIGVEQIKEIPGISQEQCLRLMQFLFVEDNFVPKKLSLNSSEFKEMMAHPYFNFYNTKKIFDHKNEKGNFTSLHDLKKVGFIDSGYVDKITPYLTVE